MVKKKWFGLAALGASLVVFAKKLLGRGPKKTETADKPAEEQPS